MGTSGEYVGDAMSITNILTKFIKLNISFSIPAFSEHPPNYFFHSLLAT